MRWLLLPLVLGCVACAADQPDPWAPLRVFEGKWEGPSWGQPGKGITTREYRFEFNGRFLSHRDRAVYEPKSPGEKPEIHEDFGVFSYDRNLKKIVWRQFHTEGFVNEYTLDSVSAEGKSLQFVTVRIENIAPGWRAKEFFHVLSPGEMEATFSLAAPGKDFEVYSQARLKRQIPGRQP